MAIGSGLAFDPTFTINGCEVSTTRLTVNSTASPSSIRPSELKRVFQDDGNWRRFRQILRRRLQHEAGQHRQQEQRREPDVPPAGPALANAIAVDDPRMTMLPMLENGVSFA